MIIEFNCLYTFTKARVHAARERARLGDKDYGRHVLHYVRNAQIVEILRPYSGQLLIDAGLLDWELRELQREVHPVEDLRPEGQFETILARLDLIAAFVSPALSGISAAPGVASGGRWLGYGRNFPVAKLRRSRGRKSANRLAVRLPVKWKNANDGDNIPMTLRVLVQSERPDEYTGKKGLVKQQIINVIDQEPGGNRLVQPLEYALTDEEKVKYAGKLQDKFIQLGVREIVPFGGRLRTRGSILSVEGMK